jgi:aryl-phospho-beta-D-glucosidase BglC (GH1 family)
MNHVHDFNHVQINWFVWDLDDVNSIDSDINKLIGKIRMKLAAE